MLPLLAVSSAVSAAGKVASSAVSAWQDLTSSKANLAKSSASADATGTDSFSALLAAQGIEPGNTSGASGTGTQDAATQNAAHGGHHGHHGSEHHVNILT